MLLVTAQYPWGSAESFVGPEVRGLLKAGVDVRLAPSRGRAPQRPQPDGAALVTPARWPDAFKAVQVAVTRPVILAMVIRDMLSDRAHLAKNLLALPRGLQLAYELGRRPVDHIHAHWLSTSGTVAWVCSRMTGTPMSITAHRWDLVDANLARVKTRDAAFVRVISQAGKRMLEETSGRSDRAVVIHMGVDVPSVTPRRGRKPTEPFRVLCPANLVQVKGHDVLLEAVAEVEHVELDLAGSGPLEHFLGRRIADLGLGGRVRMLGQLRHDDLLQRMNTQYDAVILPSLDLGSGEHEGIPVSLMEAMVRRLPVVTTSTGSIEELVTNGSDGLVVPAGDVTAIATALRRLRSDPDLAARLGSAARETIIRGYAVDTTVPALLELFERFADDRFSHPNSGRHL